MKRGVELIGKLDLFKGGNEQPGQIADVHGWGNWAYLGAFASPNCEKGGVYVLNIKDPSRPREADFIPTSDPTSFVGEGVQVLPLNIPGGFKGRLLLYSQETCAPRGGRVGDVPVLGDDPRLGVAGPGGASIVDVTKPQAWHHLADHIGDMDPPPAGALPSGFPHNAHSVFGWQQGNRAYMAIVDNGEGGTTDIDIWDITVPAAPIFVLETGAAKWPNENCDPDGADTECQSIINEDPMPNGANAFIHDFVVKKVGDRYLMLASYWDGGYVVIDLTNLPNDTLSDKRRARYLRDTDFGMEPFRNRMGLPDIPAEGNGHYAEFNRNNEFILAADEDFGPYRFLGRILSGNFKGDSFTGTEGNATPPIDREKGISGQVRHLGQGCAGGVPATEEHDVALMERGTCTFSVKVQNAQALGYKMAVIYNDRATDAPNCDAQLFMLAVGNIPSLFVGRNTGLKLLNEDPGKNSCDKATPTKTDGESFDISPLFDGWGYMHLYDARTMKALDHFAIPEGLNRRHASGSGDLSIHEVAADPDINSIAYSSYYMGGFRIFQFDRKNGIREVGAFIDRGGNNLWGVEVIRHPTAGKIVLASDRDAGLYIFGPAAPDLKPNRITLEKNPVVGEQSRLATRIANLGSLDAKDVVVRFFDNGERIGTRTVDTIAAGDARHATVPWTPRSAGEHTITVVVDPGRDIDEISERNNRFSRTYVVRP